MKKIGLIIAFMFTILLVAGCAGTGTVTGTINYLEEIALPPQGVVITVKVEDVSRADAPALTIGQQIIENPAYQVPIPFEIEYDKAAIDERYTYAMRVRIEVNGELWFTNTTRHAVITHGNPTRNVTVMLEKVGPREPVNIQDVTWKLVAYGEKGSPKAIIENTEITLELKSAEGKIGGSAGCNGYFGKYEIDGNKLKTVPPISSTMMACPEPIMKQEQEYHALLQTTETFVAVKDSLTVFCSGNKVMVFSK